MVPAAHYRPADWLRALARPQPSRWPWRRALRAAVCIAAPLAVGFGTGNPAAGLWVSMGALTTAAGEGAGAYRSRFRQMAIAAPIAACGFGAATLAGLPLPAIVAAMAALAFLAGVVDSYGAPFAIGTMQALLLAAIAIGLPEVAPAWRSALLYLAGVALSAGALAIDAALDTRRPERRMLADLVAALAHLAETRAANVAVEETPDVETARRSVTDRSRALYAAMIEARRGGRTHETVADAARLDAADALFDSLLATGDPAALLSAAAWLKALAAALRRRLPPPAPPATSALADRLGGFAASLDGRAAPAADVDVRPAPRWRLRRLTVGPAVLGNAAALALCTGIAYATHAFIVASHWFWVPLTVAIVMKPDFGSIFVRAVLRAAGTTVGVVIGAVLLAVVPKGAALVLAIGALAAVLPWAKGVSYAAQAVVLTPLVLVLLDLMVPGTVDYGWQRLTDTALGGAIVLVFGYFLWPRRHGARIESDFAAALDATATYLTAVAAPSGGSATAAGRAAYARLFDLRAVLGRAMAEPPPAGREAAAWFPAVAAAERICDRISARADGPAAALPADEVAAVAAALRSVETAAPSASMPDGDPFLRAIRDDADRLARLVQPETTRLSDNHIRNRERPK